MHSNISFLSTLLCFGRNDRTYWSTTGLFPQELVITFTASTKLVTFDVRSTGGKRAHFCFQRRTCRLAIYLSISLSLYKYRKSLFSSSYVLILIPSSPAWYSSLISFASLIPIPLLITPPNPQPLWLSWLPMQSKTFQWWGLKSRNRWALKSSALQVSVDVCRCALCELHMWNGQNGTELPRNRSHT